MEQTIKQAIYLAQTGLSPMLRRAARKLDGVPVGAWAETRQAVADMAGDLPAKSDRAYTIQEWIDAAYTVVGDRYRSRVW